MFKDFDCKIAYKTKQTLKIFQEIGNENLIVSKSSEYIQKVYTTAMGSIAAKPDRY